MFQETEISKKFSIFQETETLKSFLYFRKCNLLSQSPKNKKIHPEMELSDSKIKKFLILPEIEPCTFQPKLEK